MAKRRERTRGSTAPGEVGPRQPCPCGSGRRYKSCHGSPSGPAPVRVRRPFAGLPGECDVVAMREFVPSATAALTLAPPYADRAVLLCSLLPMAAPALVRADGTVWLGLQVQHAFGDPARELAAVLLDALAADPGSMVGLTSAPGDGPRLGDLLAPGSTVEVTVHAGFGFWVGDLDAPDPAVAASLEQAEAATAPTTRLTGVEAAYWTDVGSKEHLRWVMPHDEDALLTALARLHVAGADGLVDGGRLVGMFRAHGLLVPVWDLPPGTGAAVLEQPAAAFAEQVGEALAEDRPLSAEERSARAGLANRQLTLR